MSISNLIIHEVQKQSNDSKALLIARPNAIEIDDQTKQFSAKITDLFNRSGMNTGKFSNPNGSEDGSKLPKLLVEYFDGDGFRDFAEFSKACAVEYIRHLEPVEGAEGGLLWFHHYQVNEAHFLLVALLKRKQGVVLNTDLSLEQINQVEMDKLHMAMRINLTAWKAQDDARYIAFRLGRALKPESDYFTAFLGCNEPVQAARETRKLVELTTAFCQEKSVPQKAALELKKAVSEHCLEKVEDREPVELTDIADRVKEYFSPEDASSFLELAASESFQLEKEIFVEKAGLRKLTRYSGSNRSLSLSFDSDLLGDAIRFDETTNSLTITDLPKSLLNQLRKNISTK
ncbi:nucleoid-associated protein [Marinomonas agarivorans]|nr:nucleoid-associated protein [Marinomonas agarivorans]